jgi:hypothetical protein
LRHRFVLVVVGTLVAALCAFILTGKEAQARTNLPGPAGPVKEAHGKAAEFAGQTSRGAADHVDSSAPKVDGPARLDAEPAGGVKGGAIESTPQMIGGPGEANVGPVLQEAAQKVDPALEAPSPSVGSLASPSDPVLETATPVVESISKATTQAIEPVSEPAGTVLKGAAPAIEPVAGPLLGATSPMVVPALETASPAVEPVNGAAAPGVKPIFDPMAPAGGPVFGEGAVKGGELSTLARIADTTSALPSAISSPALTAEARSTSSDPRLSPASLGNAPGSPSNGSTGETRVSTVGLPGAHHFELFDHPLMVSGQQAALLGAIAADATERMPHPFPFGFPSGIPPPVGSSFGGFGIGFNLLGVLMLFLTLSRVGGWLRSTREAFELGPYLQLAIERPG